MSPYLVLDVPPTADDQAIRRAYLDAIKQASPESHPDRFKQVVAAYDKIKNQASRDAYELFHTDTMGESPLEAFLLYARLGAKPKPMSFAELKEYLRLCSKI